MLSIHDDKLINCAFEHEHHDHELYHEHQRCWLKIVLSRIDVAGIPWSFNTQFPMSAPQKKKKFPWSLKIIVFKISVSRGWFRFHVELQGVIWVTGSPHVLGIWALHTVGARCSLRREKVHCHWWLPKDPCPLSSCWLGSVPSVPKYQHRPI